MKVKVFVSLTVTLAVCVSLCQSSAIPMWEYLSREEKMSMLFNMFSKQVQTYCKTKNGQQNVSECKRNMMTYGVEKLNDMGDASLDKMDPYQRNADNILWDSMMNNGQSTTTETHVDERQEYLQNEQHNQQTQFNEEVRSSEKPKPTFSEDDEDEMVNYLHDGAATNYNFAYIHKPDDLDQHEHLEQNTNYLTGPMVSYMMPDGSAVKNMIQIMPIDEDREDMEMMKKRMPSMQEIYASVQTMDEKPKIIIAQPPTQHSSTTESTRHSRIVKTISGAYRIH